MREPARGSRSPERDERRQLGTRRAARGTRWGSETSCNGFLAPSRRHRDARTQAARSGAVARAPSSAPITSGSSSLRPAAPSTSRAALGREGRTVGPVCRQGLVDVGDRQDAHRNRVSSVALESLPVTAAVELFVMLGAGKFRDLDLKGAIRPRMSAEELRVLLRCSDARPATGSAGLSRIEFGTANLPMSWRSEARRRSRSNIGFETELVVAVSVESLPRRASECWNVYGDFASMTSAKASRDPVETGIVGELARGSTGSRPSSHPNPGVVRPGARNPESVVVPEREERLSTSSGSNQLPRPRLRHVAGRADTEIASPKTSTVCAREQDARPGPGISSPGEA